MNTLNVEIIELVCTGGVVACGLTVVGAATWKVVKGILESSPQMQQGPETNSDAEWPTETRKIEEPVRRRRRKGQGQPCQKCSCDLTAVAVLRGEVKEDRTLLVKQCPECGTESLFDA